MIKLLSVAAVAAVVLTGAWVVVDVWADWRLAHAQDAFEADVGPLDPQAYVPRPSDPSSPAGAWLVEALDLYDVGQEDGARLREIIQRPAGEWSDQERRLIARLAGENADALNLLRRAAAGLEHAPFPDLGGFTGEAPAHAAGLATLLRATTLLVARAGLTLGDDSLDAASDLAALARLADAVGRQPELVYPLIAHAMEKQFLHGARWMAADPGAPPEVFEALLAAMPRASAGERFSAAIAHSAARGATAIEEEKIPREGWERLAPWLRDLAQISTLDAFRAMAEASTDPLALAETGERMQRQLFIGAIVGGLLIPNLVDALYKAKAVDASRRVARLALELRLDRSSVSGGAPGQGGAGSRPAEVPSEVQVTLRDDGSALLSDPAAHLAWTERWGDQQQAWPPPYEWELPPG